MSFLSSQRTVRKLCVTAVLAAVAAILQFFEFPVPLMPSFIKMDFSDLPELLAAFAAGPLWGGAVCLVKNLIHMPFSGSLYVGELCNFLMGVTLVLPAGAIYHRWRTKTGALVACVAGCVCMTAFSYPVNYFISYPIYCQLFGGEAAVLAAYQAILPSMPSLAVCLAVFNLPFTFVKAALVSALTFALYKPLSPLLKGRGPESARTA